MAEVATNEEPPKGLDVAPVSDVSSVKNGGKRPAGDQKTPATEKKRKTNGTKAGKKATKVESIDTNAVKEEPSEDAASPKFTPPTTPVAGSGKKGKGTPRAKTANPMTPRGIPKSWDEACRADRELYVMRNRGCGWPEIRKMWKEQTGEEAGHSTLPNRFSRIKCNMMRLKPGHARILLQARDTVKRDFEVTMWNKIAATVNEETGEEYLHAFLQKQTKELDQKGGLEALSDEGEEDTVPEEDVVNGAVQADDTTEDAEETEK